MRPKLIHTSKSITNHTHKSLASLRGRDKFTLGSPVHVSTTTTTATQAIQTQLTVAVAVMQFAHCTHKLYLNRLCCCSQRVANPHKGALQCE